MNQFIKIIRKVDIEKQYEHTLKLEQDYELASLFGAMQQQNVQEIERSKKRLKEIHGELEGLDAYA